MRLIEETISAIGELDRRAMDRAQARLDNLTKPLGSLGRLEELAKHLVGITGQERPSLAEKVIVTMAADHGVTKEGVSAYPMEVTPQMVLNFLRGGAGINVLARLAGARVVVVDIGVAADLDVAEGEDSGFRNCKVAFGTKNFANGPAMTRQQAIESVKKGIEVATAEWKRGMRALGTGDMGIGNTTASAAVISVLSGREVESIVGRGTGIDDAGLARKVEVIKTGIAVNRPDPDDALDVLSNVGGFEIGGIAGMIIGCAARRVPVFLDGFISGAAAMIAVKLAPRAKGFLIAGHCSAEKGHRICLESLGLSPLLDLGLRLGEGTGAAVAIWLGEAALRILGEMATFSGAGVSRKTVN
jgi:nicotinate-nucleotide--dimethylbenzimidazole phosphoribosyltransferase